MDKDGSELSEPGPTVLSPIPQQNCSQTEDLIQSALSPASTGEFSLESQTEFIGSGRIRQKPVWVVSCMRTCLLSSDHHDLQSLVHSRPPSAPQKPLSKILEQLSPIQETSVEAISLTSLGGLSAGNCSPLEEDQDKEETGPAPSPGE